jgi:uncharacterized protein (DUF1810 family)
MGRTSDRLGAPARDPYDLERFVDAQAGVYAQALGELRAGRKRSHWSWFVFPQLRGLGRSAMAERYGIDSLDEARAYLAHPVLGARLRECVAALAEQAGIGPVRVLGETDAVKLRSCLTLFGEASGGDPAFVDALAMHFGGEPDPATLALLKVRSPGRS